MYAPDDWVQFDSTALNPGGDLSRLVWLRIPKDEESDFTVAAMRLPDGSVLQVGRCTNNREVLFQPFRRDFLIERLVTRLRIGIAGGIRRGGEHGDVRNQRADGLFAGAHAE